MLRRSGESPLRVLNVAYPLFPVRAGSGGGAEQILGVLERGLTRLGVESFVVAAEESAVSGQLIPTPGVPERITESVRQHAQEAHRASVEEALRVHDIDLIHFHGLDFMNYRPISHAAAELATLHLPIAWYPPDLLSCTGLSLNCVSENQRLSHPAAQALTVIPNGIELDRFVMSRIKQEYLLWLGRICPEKGVHIALRVAHRLDVPLIVAGPVHPFSDHQSYFSKEVEPLLDGKRSYVGSVARNQRADLLAKARCLLVPSLAPETSSLVAMEAAASGTPVIAFASGALPEIVEDGVTGFVVGSEDEMAVAVHKTVELAPEACRRVAESRFSARRMVGQYLTLYKRLVSATNVPSKSQA